MFKSKVISRYSKAIVEYGPKSIEAINVLNDSPKWFLKRINLIHSIDVIVHKINHDRPALRVKQSFDEVASSYLSGKSNKDLTYLERLYYGKRLWAFVIEVIEILKTKFPEDNRLNILSEMVLEPKATFDSPVPEGEGRECYMIFLTLLDLDLTKALVNHFGRVE